MEKHPHNAIVTLSKSGVRPPPVRIISQSTTLRRSRDFSVSPTKLTTSHAVRHDVRGDDRDVHLTHSSFSVTRAHAYARARKDEGGLKRVLDAVLSGGDAKVASIAPAPFLVRFIAVLLLPLMLVMPLAPAYANDAPLADRIAADVSALVESAALASNESISPDESALPEDVASSSDTPSVAENLSPESDTEVSADGEVDMSVAQPEVAGVTTEPSSDLAQEISPSQDLASNEEVQNITPSDTSSSSDTPVVQDDIPSQDTSPAVADGGTQEPPTQEVENSDTTTPSTDLPVLADAESVANPDEVISADPQPITEEAQLDEVVEEVPVLDVPSPETAVNLDELRAQIREELRGEVKLSLRHEVEQEVFRGCKNLDGTGYYCIPDAKSFGAPIIENERNITVVVQQDVGGGDKEIFLVRNDSTMQLTHNTDDDAFPVLDPAGDTLVWQTLVDGRWQIAYAHLDDVGVPKVRILTNGENNFNPKVYRGRIVWQAWFEGNWEIVIATPAHDVIIEDALTKEHRILGMNGEYEVRRITANNAPDMFPSLSDNTLSWQALDDGVWQVFAHDLASGETRRVSKKGVKSESPVLALVWNEETEHGAMRLVGQDVQGSTMFDFTQLAKRLVDQAREVPNAPVSNTDIVVTEPSVVRTEEEVVSSEM